MVRSAALISVSDKTGVDLLVEQMLKQNSERMILSTGGTANFLRESGLPVMDISEYTGFPEMMDGRVKTLHPKVHGAILAMRNKETHMAKIREHDMVLIDMVIVNLYPFEATVAKPGVTREEAIEQIDIGGPAMVRSAAKNHGSVTVVVDPDDYLSVVMMLAEFDGEIPEDFRRAMAQKAFAHTAQYDIGIANYLSRGHYTGFVGERIYKPRYGENPHQNAALYKRLGAPRNLGVAGAEVLNGKDMSFNNYVDADAAWAAVQEFKVPAAVVIKHTNPCGVATASSLSAAYYMARQCDPVSAYGSIVAVNQVMDGDTAKEITSTFVEVVLAPVYAPEALEVLRKKENLRVLRVLASENPTTVIRQIDGGFLLQDSDTHQLTDKDFAVVTERMPKEEELAAMKFAWKVAKHVKSNAIVFATGDRLLGVGAGQMNRLESIGLAGKHMFNNRSISGSGNFVVAMASDAMLPFDDNVHKAAEYGVSAIIQPGGSKKDADVIKAANHYGMAMVFTGIRHFKH
jgi:phosphoribosylaminoimidazolecarboxamide formyltransferase / IMP cyclohydrolase